MPNEETIKSMLIKQFDFLNEKIKITRVRRIFVDVPAEHFMAVFEFAFKQLQLNVLCTITGLDEGENLTFIYHMAHLDGTMVNLKRSVSRQKPVIGTVMALFPAAEIYERELVDLLGAEVVGLLPGNRYPLPDSFPKDQHPLRKDWQGIKKEGAAKS